MLYLTSVLLLIVSASQILLFNYTINLTGQVVTQTYTSIRYLRILHRETLILQRLFKTCYLEIKDDGSTKGIFLDSEKYTATQLTSALCTFDAKSFTETLGLKEGFVDSYINVDFSNIFKRLIVAQARNDINYEIVRTFLEVLGRSNLSDVDTCDALKAISYFVWRFKQMKNKREPLDHDALLMEPYRLFYLDVNNLTNFKYKGPIDDVIARVSEGDEAATKDIIRFIARTLTGIKKLNKADPPAKFLLLDNIIQKIDGAVKELRDFADMVTSSSKDD